VEPHSRADRMGDLPEPAAAASGREKEVQFDAQVESESGETAGSDGIGIRIGRFRCHRFPERHELDEPAQSGLELFDESPQFGGIYT